MNEQSGEMVLLDLESKVVAQAVADLFRTKPYVAAVFHAMPPADRDAVIEKVRADATEAGFQRLDADKWLSHHVDKMYDEGKLPEIEKAQLALYNYAQSQEDAFIQQGNKKDVERYLTAAYYDPAQAQFRKDGARQREKAAQADDDHIYPG